MPTHYYSRGLAILCGYQSIVFAISTKTFAISEGLLPEDPRMTRFFETIYLERGLVISFLTLLVGGGLLLAAVLKWQATGFGELDYGQTMRLVIPERPSRPWRFKQFSRASLSVFLECDGDNETRVFQILRRIRVRI